MLYVPGTTIDLTHINRPKKEVRHKAPMFQDIQEAPKNRINEVINTAIAQLEALRPQAG